MKICAVAVDAATYAIDRLYDYRSLPEEVPAVGCRVLVPFGRGNQRLEAVVLTVRDGSGEGLKPILEVLDREPVLTVAQLRLAVHLRERLFCTFFDCVRTILPAGLWFRRRERYALGECDLQAWQSRADEAGELLRQFSREDPVCCCPSWKRRCRVRASARCLTVSARRVCWCMSRASPRTRGTRRK